MIISDKDALSRLNNPMNLINQLASRESSRSSAMSLFGLNKNNNGNVKREVNEIEEVKVSFNPFESKKSISLTTITPAVRIPEQSKENIDNILDNSEQQIKLSLAHDNALKVLNDSVLMLSTKLDDVKAEKLPGVITAASKVVESIRRERIEINKVNKGRDVHYHFYTPNQKSISDYEVIEVSQ